MSTDDDPASDDANAGGGERVHGEIEPIDDENAAYHPPETTRRNAAKMLMALGGTAAVGSFAVDYVSGLSDGGLASGTSELTWENIYVKGTKLVDKQGTPVTPDTLERGGGGMQKMVALPQTEEGDALKKKKAVTLLVRYPQDAYEQPTNLGGVAKGYAAYSMVCTHEGCLVSSESGDDVLCPCHGSTYAPTKGARVTGGPAPRALPQLPLGVSTEKNEFVVATGHFEGPVGPE